MSATHAATALAVWAAARAGGASADDVLAALAGPGIPTGVRAATVEVADRTGLPAPGSATAGLAGLLPMFRRGGRPELLLPHAGDLRGLPPRGAITVPALDAGAVVVFPAARVGLVPAAGHWRAYECGGGHPVLELSLAHELIDEAIATATRDLIRADVARGNDRVRDRIREIMLAEAVDCPPGTPPRASALLAKTISLQALVAVAVDHEMAAVTSRQLGLVDDALRPLAHAVREGRRSAVAVAVTALTGAGALSKSKH